MNWLNVSFQRLAIAVTLATLITTMYHLIRSFFFKENQIQLWNIENKVLLYCSTNPCLNKLSPPCAGRADVSCAWSTSCKTQTCSFKFKLQEQMEILLRLFSYSKNNGFNYFTSCDNVGKERQAVCAPVCWTKKWSVPPLIVQESMDLSFSDYCMGGGVEPMVNQRFVDGMSNEIFEMKMI